MLMMTAALGFGALAAYVKYTPGALHVPDDMRPAKPISVPVAKDDHDTDSAPPVADSARPEVTIKSLVAKGADVSLGSMESVPIGTEPSLFVANEALKIAHLDGVQAVSASVQNRIATIDFTQEIENGMGSDQEGAFLNGLAVGLGQLPNVDKFQITVQGTPIEELGHVDVSEPQDVQRPASSPAAPATP
jgi:hypothetical protein